jgi:hypothetical protein
MENISNRKKLMIVLALLFTSLFIAYAPIIPRTIVVNSTVTIPLPNSPVRKATLNLTIPLTTTTFHIQTIDLPIDQRVNVTIRSTVPLDLVAIISNSTTETFIQEVISEVGVPIGPSLFTGKDLTPLIIPLIREKLPSILEKTAHDGYYIINKQEETTTLDLKAGSYNVIVLSFNNFGELKVRIEYFSADSITENISQTITERISILQYTIR